MERVLIYLTALAGLAKDLHYEAKGPAFYGQHLLFDRINEELLGFVDEIKENYFMYNDMPVPTAKTIYNAASLVLPDNADDFSKKLVVLNDMLKTTVYMLDEEAAKERFDVGDNDLFGRIASNLKNSRALLTRVIGG